MSFTEILDAVKAMPRGEQVSLLQTLKDEVGEASSDEALLAKSFPPGVVFEIFSPIEAFEAAHILHQMVYGEQGKP